MKTRSKKSPRGFTLIELLVAMAITTIIITVLVSVTALALDTWNRSRAEIRAARQAKSMIDSMARDFESFVSRKGNDFEWLYAKSEPPADGPNGSSSPNAIDLIFFSAATDRYEGNIGTNFPDNKGDVSTVGYELVYQNPIDPSTTTEDYKTFVLYRKLLDPDKTFGVGGAAGTLGETDLKQAFTAAVGANAVTEDINFICENVYQFTVTFHVQAAVGNTLRPVTIPVGKESGQVEEFSVMGSGIDTTFVPGAGTGVNNAQLRAGRLSAAEISITVISDFGLQQMRRRNLAGTELAEFIAKHSYQYSKVVQLPGS